MASPKTRKAAEMFDVQDIQVGTTKISATLVDDMKYSIEVSYNSIRVKHAVCTCNFTGGPACPHILAVIKKADDVLFEQESLALEFTEEIEFDEHNYLIKDLNFAELDMAFIYRHSGVVSDFEFNRVHFNVDEIRFGFGRFVAYQISKAIELEVKLTEDQTALNLHCTCKFPKKLMCKHMTSFMYQLINSSDLRMMFDNQYRIAILKKEAAKFGLENVEQIEDYLDISYSDYNGIQIESKLKGLVAIDPTYKLQLKQKLSLAQKPDFFQKTSTEKVTFVVLSTDNYQDQLEAFWCSANLAKNGVIKNPITKVDLEELIIESDDIQELKFFTAIQVLSERRYHIHKAKEIKALKSLIAANQNKQFYKHNGRKSSNLTSTSLEEIKISAEKIDFGLKVNVRDAFYEISIQIQVNDRSFPASQLKVLLHYFVADKGVYFLLDHPKYAEIIEFFRKNGGKIVIHESKFESFKTEVLDELESNLRIQYTYLKKASAKQQAETVYNQEIKKVLYLSEEADFVLITPSVIYGEIEIPVLSQKNLVGLDEKGESFILDRNTTEEERFVASLLQQHPDFEVIDGIEYVYLPKSRFLNENWFLPAFESWKEQGIEVLGFNKLKNNKLNQNKAKIAVQVSKGLDWFETKINVAFAGEQVSLKSLQKAIKNKTRYVTLGDGTHGVLPEEWLEKMARFFRHGEVKEDRIRSSNLLLTAIDTLYEEEDLDDALKLEVETLKQKMASFKSIEKVEVPKSLNANLRSYQKEGLNWLNFLDEFNFGGCLADDMGLGKTIQILAFLLLQRKRKEGNTNLIVVPTSLIFNWEKEIAKFAPDLKYKTIYGANRIKNTDDFSEYELILTSYGTLLSDIKFLKDFRFNYAILDESQAIKNPESQRFKAVRLIQARNRLVMTGTPIENNTFDIYAQLTFACPGLLGTKTQFRDEFSTPIDRFSDIARTEELKRRVNPFVLRRTKKQVATELPEKTEMILYCEMGQEQRQVYDALKNDMREYLNASKKKKQHLDTMHILAALTKLRQICNSPALLKDDEFYGEESAKINVLMEEINTKKKDHKLLIFSQFVGMLDLIKIALEKENIKYSYLTGQSKNREKIVEEFQDSDEIRVFLISLKAGGTGLNLTEADYVYLVDPWWNPAVENQAIDRCYRIGQEKHVMAVRLIASDTIEEKIMQLQNDKRSLASDLIQTDQSISKSFSETDWMDLFS